MAGTLRFKVSEVRRKIPAYSDNIKWLERLLESKGELFTLDERPYVELMNEYAVFYTLRKENPVKKKTIRRVGVKKTEYVKRASQATRKAPTKRLVARRKANAVGSGRFPNPAPKKDAQPYKVQILSTASKTQSWKTVARFAGVTEAKDYANAYPRAYKVAAVRVYVD